MAVGDHDHTVGVAHGDNRRGVSYFIVRAIDEGLATCGVHELVKIRTWIRCRTEKRQSHLLTTLLDVASHELLGVLF